MNQECHFLEVNPWKRNKFTILEYQDRIIKNHKGGKMLQTPHAGYTIN